MTRTETRTRTTTRSAVVFWQFKWVMVNILDNGERLYAEIVNPALVEKAIRALRFYGLDPDGTTRAELHLMADWKDHEQRLDAASVFTLPAGWSDEVSPQVRLAVKRFVTQVDEEGLVVRPFLSLIPGRVPQAMRSVPRRSLPRLATGRIMCDEELRHLVELRLYYAQAND